VLNVDPFENLLHLAPGFALLYAGFAPGANVWPAS
jgi:hypothetical protein